jgi:hypothetical protein
MTNMSVQNQKEEIYFIHNNGDRPYMVKILDKEISIYKYNHLNEIYDILILKIYNSLKIFIGDDKECVKNKPIIMFMSGVKFIHLKLLIQL